MKLKILFIVVITIVSIITADTKINFHGHIPNGISETGLQREYHRIASILELSDNLNQNAIEIYYYSNKEEKILGVRLPEWGGGGAIGQDTIIIPVYKKYAFYPDDYLRITLHELVHIALARAYQNIRIPRWFHEGMAMTFSGELSFDEGALLSKAIITRSLLPFDSIEYVNRFNHYKAQIAYSQSHFAIQYMTKLYGYDMLPELLDSARVYRKFDTACMRVFGLTVDEFETIVKNQMVVKYRYAFLFSDYSMFWIIASFLVITGFIITLYRNRKRRLAMETEDKLSDSETNQEDGDTLSGGK